ncbi:MAG: hypothetical protein ABSG83_01220 [Roseiarcus sp.]|jgi:hypothetical protein
MTHSFLAGAGLGLLALMFLPVLIAVLRGRWLVALVALVMVLVSIVGLIHPPFGVAVWLIALCVGAFAGRPRVIVVARRGP